MCDSGVKMNCVLLTTLMKGFIRSHHLDKAMALFDTMRSAESQVKPDMITCARAQPQAPLHLAMEGKTVLGRWSSVRLHVSILHFYWQYLPQRWPMRQAYPQPRV